MTNTELTSPARSDTPLGEARKPSPRRRVLLLVLSCLLVVTGSILTAYVLLSRQTRSARHVELIQKQYFGMGFDSAHAVFERYVAAYRAGQYNAGGTPVQLEQFESVRMETVAREICTRYKRTSQATRLIHSFAAGYDCFWGIFRRYQQSHAGDTDWEMERALDELRSTLQTSGLGMSEAAADAYVEANREFRADYEAQLKTIEQLYAHLLR